MSFRNKMKTLLSQDDWDAIDEIIKGKLASLTPEERARYGRINGKKQAARQ